MYDLSQCSSLLNNNILLWCSAIDALCQGRHHISLSINYFLGGNLSTSSLAPLYSGTSNQMCLWDENEMLVLTPFWTMIGHIRGLISIAAIKLGIPLTPSPAQMLGIFVTQCLSCLVILTCYWVLSSTTGCPGAADWEAKHLDTEGGEGGFLWESEGTGYSRTCER